MRFRFSPSQERVTENSTFKRSNLRGSDQLWFGADLFNVRTELGASTHHLGPIVISVPLLIGFVIALVASGLLAWFLSSTVWGYRVRATAEDPVMAELCGVTVQRPQ